MKKSVPAIALLCTAIILFTSCAISKNSVYEPKPETEKKKEGNSSCYVIKTDGSTQYYSSLKLVTGVFITPHLVADNNIVINAKDVLVYQDKQRYAVSQKLLATSKTSYVATETLPGFAVRVVSGKLNVYTRKFYDGRNIVKEYFLQSGDEGQIIAYSSELMRDLVKDNVTASDYFNNKVKISPRSKKLMATADIYNNSQLLSKN